MPFWKKGKTGGEPTRLFYACDIHGSEPTYRKFLNAAKFYEVDALMFGGDLMGKLLIPIVRDAGGTTERDCRARTTTSAATRR